MKNLLLLSIVVIAGFIYCNKLTNSHDETLLSPTAARVDSAVLEDKVLTQNLSHVWEIVWGPDKFLWITERSGRISRVNPADGSLKPLLTIPDAVSIGEGGLLGMALHPNFSANPFVYVAYNYQSNSSYVGKIVRFTYNGTNLSSPLTLLDGIKGSNVHNGCRLVILKDKLFISTGDAAVKSLPQDTASLNGKILRINLDGSIPADNPFPGSRVWSLGHRNPQGLVRVGEKLFSSEHGPSSDDEINLIEKGRNYGWPQIFGPCTTTDELRICKERNVKEPLWSWTPTVAVCGLGYYDKNLIPQWKNSLLLLTLKGKTLYQLKLNGNKTAITEAIPFFTKKHGRMRSICVAPDGKVYIGTSIGTKDKIIVVGKRGTASL